MKTHTTPECYPCIHSQLWQIRSSYFSGWCFVKKQKMHKSKIALNFYTAVKNTNDQNIKKQLNGWRFETTVNIADFNQTGISDVNRVLIGIINLTGYISFDINWIRLQFQCTGDDAVYCRIIYGKHTSAKWIKIA